MAATPTKFEQKNESPTIQYLPEKILYSIHTEKKSYRDSNTGLEVQKQLHYLQTKRKQTRSSKGSIIKQVQFLVINVVYGKKILVPEYNKLAVASLKHRKIKFEREQFT